MTVTAEKALRLLMDGHVTPTGAASVFDVQGATGRYRVVIGDGFAACSCPALGRCSHMSACETWIDCSPEDRATLASIHGGAA